MKKLINEHFFVFMILCFLCIVAAGLLSGLRLCSVESGSMEPNIPTWSLCVVNTRAAYEEIEVGDVVVYLRASDGKRIIHRVIEITDEGMVTKGDANAISDGLSVTREKDNLFGKSLFHVPFLGWLSMAVRTTAGRCVVVLLAAAVIVEELLSFRKKKPEEQE